MQFISSFSIWPHSNTRTHAHTHARASAHTRVHTHTWVPSTNPTPTCLCLSMSAHVCACERYKRRTEEEKGSATDKSLIECVLLENVFSYIQIDLLTWVRERRGEGLSARWYTHKGERYTHKGERYTHKGEIHTYTHEQEKKQDNLRRVNDWRAL